MIKEDECVSIVREMDLKNRWLFLTVGTLCAMALASVFAFVFTRNVMLSEQAKNEFQLQRQELQRWEQLIETIPGGICLVDVKTTRITYCNEGFRQITGRVSSDLIGRSILTVIPNEAIAKHRKMLIDNREKTWERYGFEQFVLPHGKIELPNGSVLKRPIRIRGNRIDGSREWVIFIDPREVSNDTTASVISI